MLIYFIETEIVSETERSSTVAATLTSLFSTITFQSTTETIVETEIVTNIETSNSQTSSTRTSSLSSTQISAQQSSLSTEEGQNLTVIFSFFMIPFCKKKHIESLLCWFIL